MPGKRLYAPYSLVISLFFFGVSAMQFHSVLFEAKGFEGFYFGALMMAGALSGLASPPIMAFAVRGFGRNTHAILCLGVIAGSSLIFLPKIESFPLLMGTFFLHTFCVWSLFPLVMSCGLDVVREGGDHNFLFFRALGTAGFSLGCVFAYFIVDHVPLAWLYLAYGLAYAFALLFTWRLNQLAPPAMFRIRNPSELSAQPFGQLLRLFLREKVFLGLLGIIAIMSCANTMAISVQGNYVLRYFGEHPSLVSLSWVWGTVLEIPIMLFCLHRLKNKGLHAVLTLSLYATGLRLLCMGVPQSVFFYGLGLALHGFYWAGVVTSIGIIIDRRYQKHRASFQIGASLLYAGLPASLGNFSTGWIWKVFSLQAVYYGSFLLALLALGLILWNSGRLKAWLP